MNFEQWKAENDQYEKPWWGDCVNTADEEVKQLDVAKYMGLETVPGYIGGNFNLRGKSVLDIGGGPISLLLKSQNRGRSVVVDPCSFPTWVHDRYKAANIEYIQMMGEEIPSELGEFDEVWVYNVLQHAMDPEKILQVAKDHGKVVRVFDWVNTQPTPGHPNTLTKNMLDQILEVWGQTVDLTYYNKTVQTAYYATVNKEDLKPKIRFHLLGLAHLPTRKEISTCAYTQKVYKLGIMLKSLGHNVIFYGVENSEGDIIGNEWHQVLSDKERRDCYGDYDWHKEFFKHDGNDSAYTKFSQNTINIINKIKQPRDILLASMGTYQYNISKATGVTTVESGIGYRGVFANYRIFESYAWMHYIYGMLKQDDGSWYDAVIPNYFDPADFPYCEDKDDYFLYIGRIIKRKGVELASQIARFRNKKLIIAGQGDLTNPVEGIDLSKDKHVEYVGSVGPEERAKLMGHAKLVLMPTYYIEPFGGVAVESQMCGTPVLTTDWGVFSETVQHGVTGYRCRTFDDFLWAAKQVEKGVIKPSKCHKYAVSNYSMDRVKLMYDEFLTKVYDINKLGWYEIHKGRKQLDWLKKTYV